MAEADTKTLNDITTILIDASRLYDEAADIAGDPSLRDELRQLAAERRRLTTAYQAQVRRIGGEPVDDGSVLGAGHLAFLKLRAVVQDDAKAAVAEVERGEDYLRDQVRKRREARSLSAETRAFLDWTLEQTRADHDRIGALKHAMDELPG